MPQWSLERKDRVSWISCEAIYVFINSSAYENVQDYIRILLNAFTHRTQKSYDGTQNRVCRKNQTPTLRYADVKEYLKKKPKKEQ